VAARGTKQAFDARWTPFFTPHSTEISPELLAQAKTSIYWDDSPSLRGPAEIRAAAQKAKRYKFTGFVPSLEGFSFVAKHAEGGERYLVGRRLKPFGFDWLADGQIALDEPLVRLNRIAVREYTRDPDLADGEFRKVLRRELFGGKKPAPGSPDPVDDLLLLQAIFTRDRSWFSPSPLVVPELFKELAAREQWPAQKRAEYRASLDQLKHVAVHYAESTTPVEKEIGQIARRIVDRWLAADVESELNGPALPVK
jgi:hypothetical protein